MRLAFRSKFISMVYDGSKKQTIRKWDKCPFKKGDIVQLRYTSQKLLIGHILHVRLGDLTEADMQDEGLTLEEFRIEYEDIYGKYDENDAVFLIKFELL